MLAPNGVCQADLGSFYNPRLVKGEIQKDTLTLKKLSPIVNLKLSVTTGEN